jgi:hypothetical protein
MVRGFSVQVSVFSFQVSGEVELHTLKPEH